MKYAVLIDFGSTYTKMVCVNLTRQKVVVTDKFPSTVHKDATIGVKQCFDAAKEAIGNTAFKEALKLATSSAAGGLRMSVLGLTKSISIEAGRNASFSAGAKIVTHTTGIISTFDIQSIEEKKAEILLFCGGHECGNTELLYKNAEILSNSTLSIPIIYAGNSYVSQDIRKMFLQRGKECFLADNIIPGVGQLNIESTAAIIRDLFMKRITNMKGVGVVQTKMDGPIIPTPAAVLSAGELLSQGTKEQAGVGSMMMVDIGGATTDIYSYVENRSYQGAKRIGSPEPMTKRTVEGDMGMRESSVCLVEEVGESKFAKAVGLTIQELKNGITKRISDTGYLAENEQEKKIDHNLAHAAVNISVRRHAGYVMKEFNDGCRLVQRGKNLTDIKTVIGTGGIIVNNKNANGILNEVRIKKTEIDRILLPDTINTLIDHDYVLFAAGLLRQYDEEAALAIMKTSLGLA